MDKIAMRRKPVESSNINSIGHNFLTKNLEVEFKGGNVYRYKKVPRYVYKDFIGADSKGRYFYRNIRFDYPYRKYQDEDGNKVKGEWRTLQRKTASEMIDEMYKEANILQTGLNAAKGLGKNLATSATQLGAKNIAMNAGKSAIGGAITGGAAGLLNGQKDENGKTHRMGNAVKGALVGGTVGAGMGAGGSIVSNMNANKTASEIIDEMYKEATNYYDDYFETVKNYSADARNRIIKETEQGIANLKKARNRNIAKSTGLGASGGAVLGSALGAGINGYRASRKFIKDESAEDRKRRISQAMRKGALVGGGIGAGTGAGTGAVASLGTAGRLANGTIKDANNFLSRIRSLQG